MKIAITGSSGFVGQNLIERFEKEGFEIIRIKRSDLQDLRLLTNIIENSDILINLAGANILARWSEYYKKILFESRIWTTKQLILAMETAFKKPKLFISTSAVGIYPDDNKIHDDYDQNYDNSFLAHICKNWEAEALKAKNFGIRTVIFRFGIVLGNGGAISKMLIPFRLFLGGSIGNGEQPFPFIHINDLLNVYIFAINNDNMDGVYNLVEPQIITNKEFTKVLSQVIHRPAFFNVPKIAVKLLFGEGASVLTGGQKVIPQRLLDIGFHFKFETIEKSLKNIFQ